MGLNPVESNAVSIVQIPVELDNPIPISEPAPPPPPQPMIHNELTVPSITISPPSPEATISVRALWQGSIAVDLTSSPVSISIGLNIRQSRRSSVS